MIFKARIYANFEGLLFFFMEFVAEYRRTIILTLLLSSKSSKSEQT